jgi:DUF4097 and DUF4098 domain-containing protein YvlB
MTDNVTDKNEIKRSFPVSGLARLSVQNVDGQIDIAPGEDGVISVRAYKHPGPGANQTEIEISQDADGRVSVITHYLEDLIARLFHPLHSGPARVDYTIRLPMACQVEVATVSGPARLQGLAGEFDLRSVSGPIVLQDLSGRLRLNTVSGSATGAQVRLEDSLTVETVSGDIILADSFVPAVAANSVSAQVRLQSALGAGPYQFHSVSGDVWLDLPAAAACQVDLHSLSGRLHTVLPASRQQVRGGWTRVAIGDAGGPEIRLHSVSGDLHLLAPESPAEVAPDAPAPAPDRMDVLDRLARGELSVDEAVNTLKQ